METTAVYPGSFDPITNGHMDIIKRAAKVFDRVIVLVADNYSKPEQTHLLIRLAFIKKAIEGMENVQADILPCNLLSTYVKSIGTTAIVRGLRAVSDFEYEFQMALFNKRSGAETVFFTTSAENMYLSSSIVRQLAMYNEDINDFVPECIVKDVNDNYVPEYIKNLGK